MTDIVETEPTEEEIKEVFEGNFPNYSQQLKEIEHVLLLMPKHHRHALYLWLNKEFGLFK